MKKAKLFVTTKVILTPKMAPQQNKVRKTIMDHYHIYRLSLVS